MIKNYLDKFSLKGKKAFIIGGCGLIGSEISEALLSASAEVYIFDNNKKKGNFFRKKFINRKYNFIYFDMNSLIKKAIEKDYKVTVYPIARKHWIDVGQLAEYKKHLNQYN
jgi:nucleoside-diphosphate-sugar epimerase